MRLPLNWLHDYVRPDMSARELADRLAMTGTEVDRIHHYGVAAIEHFVVGRVLRAEQHPNADRLRVCDVAVGEGDVIAQACGFQRKAAADAPGRAGDQGRAAHRSGLVDPAEFPDVEGDHGAEENSDGGDGDHGSSPALERALP